MAQHSRPPHDYTKPAALLQAWRTTQYPNEFYNAELGLPYQSAEGGLTQADLLQLAGRWGQASTGRGCVMGVDQGNGLHIVVKEPHLDKDVVLTVRVEHVIQTDESFSHLDRLMDAYDVRACVIDGMPNTHAARAFSRRFPGRVWMCWYGDVKGKVAWGKDKENTPMVTANRTESLDAWRDVYKQKKRRIPRVEDEVVDYVRQMTNTLRKVEEDPVTGAKKAVWIKRGPDHYAHADNYAEIALGRMNAGRITATVIG